MNRKDSTGLKLHQQHDDLMMKCAETFQELFVRIMETKVFPNDFDVGKFMTKMVKRPQDTLTERTRLNYIN